MLTVFIIDFIATLANASADYFMVYRLGRTIGKWKIIKSWTRDQWIWHIFKWIHFNGMAAAFSIREVGVLKTVIIGLACWPVWNLTYKAWQKYGRKT
jgi:membrane protein DedA with SNARE-associated domain